MEVVIDTKKKKVKFTYIVLIKKVIKKTGLEEANKNLASARTTPIGTGDEVPTMK